MNTGFINGFSTNGAAYPSWVVRAVVVAVAAASVTVAPTRITFASALGDAAVSVTLTQTHTIQARVNGTADTSSFVQPRLVYAGSSAGVASATGNGAVRRDVFATAGGDATCTGEALTAQALGEVAATAASTVVLAKAHIIHPGRALVTCLATATGTGDVTRYPTVVAGLGSVGYTRGEASVQRSGESFKRLDGYVPGATSGAVADIPADRVKIIATFGSFDYADSTGTARSFVVFSGRSMATGVNTRVQAVATHIQRPTATGTATATADVSGTRTVLPVATATAAATALPPRGLVKHAAIGAGAAEATVVASAGVRTAFGVLAGVALAASAGDVVYGVQHHMAGTGTATATGTASAKYLGAGRSLGTSGGESFPATPGTQHWGGVSAAVGQADSQPATATQIKHAFATGTALGTAQKALGFANSDTLAPDGRYMRVPQEGRDMAAYFEERTMVVTA